jgi:hypothetical protein
MKLSRHGFKWVTMTLVMSGSMSMAQALPSTDEEALNGTKVNLQQAVAGKRAVLIFGFSKEAGQQTSPWREQLTAAVRARDAGPAPALFELPLMEGLPGLLRGFVLRSMRKAIPAAAQGSVVPVFSHKKEWQALAGYSSPDDAYVVVLDERQAVIAKDHGPVTPERLTAVLGALKP